MGRVLSVQNRVVMELGQELDWPMGRVLWAEFEFNYESKTAIDSLKEVGNDMTVSMWRLLLAEGWMIWNSDFQSVIKDP